MTSETEGKELLAASPQATEEFEFSINDDEDDDDEILISSPEPKLVSESPATPEPVTKSEPAKSKVCFLVDSDDDEEDEEKVDQEDTEAESNASEKP